jgi:hypothetical protein
MAAGHSYLPIKFSKRKDFYTNKSQSIIMLGMMLSTVYNLYLDALGVPPMPDVYFWPPRQAEMIVEFLWEHDPYRLQIFLKICEEMQ